MRSRETHAAISRAFESLSAPLPPAAAPITKPYPMSRSQTAMFAEYAAFMPDGTEHRGGAYLSTTKPRRALWRLIAHVYKQLPDATRVEACFPSLDIYCGEDQA